ncbi:hypothetical protein [Corynebacterium sp. Marseille-P4321]|uniref:hypothetical protein n=1 Tax=Corynebacterium sp. Marseille-P4321 TaxID=2736603 RepID=UPI000A69AF86|nr:hypothetical protein [Corynebacterium sp. Marseille-P4321]
MLDVIGNSVPAFTVPYALLARNDSAEFGTDDDTVVGIINRSDINRYLVSTFIDPVPSA